MNELDKLAFLTALQKVVNQELDACRAECDGKLLDEYQEDGTKSKVLRINGQNVGNFIVTLTKPDYMITDKSAFEEFALDYGMGIEVEDISPGYRSHAVNLLKENLSEDEAAQAIEHRVDIQPNWKNAISMVDGVPCFQGGLPVPGIEYVQPHPKCTQVRDFKMDIAVPAIRKLGGDVNALLLSGGE